VPDPRLTLNLAPMTWRQILIVAIAAAINSMDGYDLLSISFAAPVIAAEWHISRVALGVVLSMELVGMGIGSLLFGGSADRFGRRPTILGCLLLMTVGMLGATTASGPETLSGWRILTGLGIGGMLTTVNAVTAEFSNARRRSLNISIMVIGYSLGSIIGGTIASALLREHGWQAVFYLGAAATGALVPVVYLLVPESVHWLVRKQPVDALARTNRSLRRIGQAAVSGLPEAERDSRRVAFTDAFKPGMLGATLLLTLLYVLHMLTLYFILKWTPKVVVDLGFDPASAGGVLVWSGVGGAVGGVLFGLLTLRLPFKPLLIGVFVLSAAFVAQFGRSPVDLASLSLYAALAGFFCSGGVVGCYALMARTYPTHIRGFGTGFTLSVGRAGAVLSPILTGLLFTAGLGLPSVAMIMATGSLGAALALAFFRMRSAD